MQSHSEQTYDYGMLSSSRCQLFGADTCGHSTSTVGVERKERFCRHSGPSSFCLSRFLDVIWPPGTSIPFSTHLSSSVLEPHDLASQGNDDDDQNYLSSSALVLLCSIAFAPSISEFALRIVSTFSPVLLCAAAGSTGIPQTITVESRLQEAFELRSDWQTGAVACLD